MKKALLILTIISLMLILAGCHEPTETAKDVQEDTPKKVSDEIIKIGYIGPLTGDAAEYGIPVQAVMKIAMEEINSKDGIGGKKIEFIWEDGKCTPKDATTAAQKLVNVDKVKFIAGVGCSGEILATAPIAEENKVILLGATTSSPDVTSAGDFVFRTYPSDAFSASVAAEYAYNTLGAKKAAIINENTDYAQALGRVFKQSFEDLGGEIVTHESFNPEGTEFKTQVLKIKESSTDVIYVAPQTAAKGILLMRQLRDGGLDQQLLAAEIFFNLELIGENKVLDGLIGLEPAFDEDNTKAKNLFDKYREEYNKEPPLPFFMASGYDNVYLLKEAIEAVGTDTEKVRDWLYNVEGWDGAAGKITIDENGDPIMKFAIKKIKDGQIVELE